VKELLPSGNFGKLLDEKRQRRSDRPCARRWLKDQRIGQSQSEESGISAKPHPSANHG
jgi:hypothetical protein